MPPYVPLHLRPDAYERAPDEEGAFLSFLDSIGGGGRAVRNILMGNLEGAGRNVVDLAGDIIDAPLPGDWIPHISRNVDRPEFSDVIGGMDPGIGKTAVDIIGGIATDPVSYIPGAAIATGAGKVLTGAKAAAKLLPAGEKIVKGAEAFGQGVRAAAGAQRLTPEAEKALGAGKAARASEGAAGKAAIEGADALKALKPDERKIVGDIIDNFRWEGDELAGELLPGSTKALERIAAHPGVTPENAQRVQAAVEKTINIGQAQAKRPGIFRQEAGVSQLPEEYLGRSYTGQREEDVVDAILGRGRGEMGLSKPAKARTLKTTEEVKDYLKSEPGVRYERDVIKRLAERAQAQGSLAGSADIGRQLLGEAFTLTDDVQRKALTEKFATMAKSADPIEVESARVLSDAFNGLKPRGPLTDALAKVNRVVKPMMVYGYAIPKFGSIVRNKIAGIWSAASEPGSRGVALQQLKRFPSDIYGAVHDSLGLKVGKDKLGEAMGAIEDALRQSDGLAENAVGILQRGAGAGGYTADELAGLLRSGAMTGFVSSEDLIKTMSASKAGRNWKSVAEWPARMFKGVEDRMRGGMYLDLIRKGKSSDDAAKIVRDSLFDYDISSAENRVARDAIPFFQFTAKAVPQQAKLMAEKPWIAVGLASLLASKEDQPLYPYMEGRLNIPLGMDEETGNFQYASGFGLPFEALAQLPNPSADLRQFGREVGRTLVGSSQPLLKTAGALAFGTDPYFGTPVGSYSKLPGNIEAGQLGQAYNLAAGTGLLQPISGPAGQLGKLFDERRSLPLRGLDLLTGANVVSVDPDLALQQQLTQELLANPQIRQARTFYGEGDATDELLERYKAAKAKVKAKRQAAESK